MAHHPHKHDVLVVIVGLGRVGRALAAELSALGDAVLVVDERADALDALPSSFSGFRVQGDAGELGTLERARLDEAGVLFATTDDDNLNLMVAQAARVWFAVPRAIARVGDPARHEVYASLQVETLDATELTAQAFIARLDAPGGPA